MTDPVATQAFAAASDRLEKATTPEGNLLDAWMGLRHVAALINLPPVQPDVVEFRRLEAALVAVAPVVAESARPWVSEADIDFGLGAASSFLTLFTPGFDHTVQDPAVVADWIDHIGLLSAQLAAAHYRNSLALRGDMLTAHIQFRREQRVSADVVLH